MWLESSRIISGRKRGAYGRKESDPGKLPEVNDYRVYRLGRERNQVGKLTEWNRQEQIDIKSC